MATLEAAEDVDWVGLGGTQLAGERRERVALSGERERKRERRVFNASCPLYILRPFILNR